MATALSAIGDLDQRNSRRTIRKDPRFEAALERHRIYEDPWSARPNAFLRVNPSAGLAVLEQEAVETGDF
jgi:hypothetical protein